MEETISKIRKFVLENFLFTDDESILRNEDSLLENGIVDSTGMLELMAFISGEFHITLEDEEIVPENLDSVDCIAAFILRKTTGAG